MMKKEKDYYSQRDMRSHEMGLKDQIAYNPVTITIGQDVASSPQGQMIVISLINQIARFHRVLVVSHPKSKLLWPNGILPGVYTGSDLSDGLEAFVKAINPFINYKNKPISSNKKGLAITVDNIDWYIGYDEEHAYIDDKPILYQDDPDFSLSAAFTACIGSSIPILTQTGAKISRSSYSLASITGNTFINTEAPLDLGNVMVVGAGGVGSCFIYWLQQANISGKWIIIDGDTVELSNTNRCLGMTYSDINKNKASVASSMLPNSKYFDGWYGDYNQDNFQPDIILPLANEQGVRTAIAQRGMPFILHATTSTSWEAQLHRHIPYVDDCIVCRMPTKQQEPLLKCATVSLSKQEKESDASLAFISGTAGLMLLSALYGLKSGHILSTPENAWRFGFKYAGEKLRTSRYPNTPSDHCPGINDISIAYELSRGNQWSKELQPHL